MNDASIQTGVWYCVEGEYKSQNYGKLWVDGNNVISRSIAGETARDCNEVRVGMSQESYGVSITDCCVVADTYIDPEAAGQTYEIAVDVPCRSLAALSQECTFNIAEDAVAASQAVHAPESTFNLQRDAVTQALSNAIIELVTGLIEIFKDAMATAQAAFALESAFNINKDAIATAGSEYILESIFNVVKDAVAEASASLGVCGVYPLSVEAAAKAGTTAVLRQILGIGKDAVVVTVSTPLIQSAFNLRPGANVKLLAEVAAVKEGEIKVTRLFLIVGNLAIQLTGN